MGCNISQLKDIVRAEPIKPKLNTPAPKQDSINYEAHVENIGWMGVVGNGSTAGTTGQGKRLEALKIWVPNSSIRYKGHVENIGWQNWVKDGAIAGTTGKGLRMEAIEIRLTK